MGGNALKTIETVRLDRESYARLANEITKRLEMNYGIVSNDTISFRNKPDFGDLDLLVKKSTIDKYDIRELIEFNFNPREIYHNGNAWSFDYKNFQVDLIIVDDEYWVTTNVYFSYNDLGNLMGRISNRMGFRYGDYGLKLNYYFDGKKFSRNISTDPEKIFEFLGFDWERYSKGFDDLDDIFEFVVNSKYFSSEVFAYESLNHQNRTRNKKRKNYRLFLEYIEETVGNKKFDYLTLDGYIVLAEKFFNVELFKDINEWVNQIKLEKQANEKFNGSFIIEYFGLKGKDIGTSITKFKNHVKEENYPNLTDVNEVRNEFSRWVLNVTDKELWDTFKNVNNL